MSIIATTNLAAVVTMKTTGLLLLSEDLGLRINGLYEVV